jgi:phage tail protein X
LLNLIARPTRKLAVSPRSSPAPSFACLLAVICALSGCAPASVKLAPADLAQLQVEREILALHYYTEPAKVVDPLKEKLTNPGLADLGMLLLPGGLVLTLIDIQRKHDAAPEIPELRLNPADDVKQQVLAQLRTRGFTNMRSMWEPIRDDSREALERQFGKSAVVLLFKTTRWTVISMPSEKNRHGFPAAVRAQLLRLADQRVLWQANCDIRAPEIGGEDAAAGQTAGASSARPATSARWLFERVNEAAATCATDLLRQWDERRGKDT